MSFRRSRLVGSFHHVGHHTPGMMNFSTDTDDTIQGVSTNVYENLLRIPEEKLLLDQWLNVAEWSVELTLNTGTFQPGYPTFLDYTLSTTIATGRTGTIDAVGDITFDSTTPITRSELQTKAVETVITTSQSTTHDSGDLSETFDMTIKIPHGKWAFNNATRYYTLGLELTYLHALDPYIDAPFDISDIYSPEVVDNCYFYVPDSQYDGEGYDFDGFNYTYTCISTRSGGSFSRTFNPYETTLADSTFLDLPILTKDTIIVGNYKGNPFDFSHTFTLVITPHSYYGSGLQT